MRESEEKSAKIAEEAGENEIQPYLHDPSPRVIRALLTNRNMAENDAIIIANRTNVPVDVLEAIAKDKRWSDKYQIRLALARNPRSPLTVTLPIARFLRIFDLEEITRSHQIPVVFRRKVEAMIIERVPTMPLGNKKTLAKKAAGAVLMKLLQDRIPEIVGLCLNNPHMIEAHLYKVISRADTIPETILMISRHPLWSTRPLIRLSLVRNTHTPLSTAVRFLKEMKLTDLRELYSDPSLLVTIRPFVHRELLNRGSEPASSGEERIFEIREEDFEEAEAALSHQQQEGPGDDETGDSQEERDDA